MKRNKLKVFRKARQLTQPEMAEKLGISTSHYKSIERGAQNPSYTVMMRFSEYFNTDRVWQIFKKE